MFGKLILYLVIPIQISTERFSMWRQQQRVHMRPLHPPDRGDRGVREVAGGALVISQHLFRGDRGGGGWVYVNWVPVTTITVISVHFIESLSQ